MPRRRAGLIGALSGLGAAVLTMIGMFQELLTAQVFFGPERQTFVITSWGTAVETKGAPGEGADVAPLNGVPLLCAAAGLLAAAVLGMLAANRPSGGRLSRVRGLVAVVTTTFLAAAVAMIGMQELWWLNIFQPPEATGDSTAAGIQEAPTVTVGPGFWTLVIAVGLAVVAAVLAWRQSRPEPVRAEPDTPRLGIPVVVHRLPDAEPDEPPAG